MIVFNLIFIHVNDSIQLITKDKSFFFIFIYDFY